MKCLLCPTEIDEKREFKPEISKHTGKLVFDEEGQRQHAHDLSQWEQVKVSATRGMHGDVELLVAHVCPQHILSAEPQNFELVFKKGA